MKQRYLKLCALFLAIVLVVCSAPYVTVEAVAGAQGTQPTTYSKSSNSGTRGVWCTTLSGTSALTYYTVGVNDYDTIYSQSSSQILNALRSLMKSTHKKSSSYDDCKNMADETDCERNSGKMVSLYTSYTTNYNGSSINREHVWPKSLGGYNTSGPGSDLHHIRPTEITPNSNRGNLKYGNVSGGKTSIGNASGKEAGHYGSYFEPLDIVKGDVARICLYMYVRYGGESQYTCGNITTVFQSIDVLLEWCELDPVDTWEMGRNEVVGAYQGNRNVFIDYPEYAWMIFGREVPDDMVTPSGNAANGNVGGGGSTGGSTNAPVEEETEAPSGSASTGTLAAPLTPTEALNANKNLAEGSFSSEAFYVKGRITAIGETLPTHYKEVKISDGENEVLIYTINLTNGINSIAVGDTITACGHFKNFYGTIEMATNGVTYVQVVAKEGGTSETPTEKPTEAPTEKPTEKPTESQTEVTTEPPEVDTEEKLENTLSFADKDQRTEFSADIQIWEQNGITLTNKKASSQNSVADYINPVRLYGGSTVQIESENMSQIVFKCSSSTYAGNLAKSLNDLSGATVTTGGSDITVVFAEPTDEFTFTCVAQIRLNSLAVTSVLVEEDDEKPTDRPTEETTEKVTEAPTEETTEKVTEAPSEETTEKVTEAPSEETTEKVTEAPSEETTEKVTEAPSEETTEKTTEAPSEETTEKVTEAPTEETTEKTTEAPTEETTEETTEVSTDAPETPTDPDGSDESETEGSTSADTPAESETESDSSVGGETVTDSPDASETEPGTSDGETVDSETEDDVTEQPSETEYPEQDPPEMPETKPATEPETEPDGTDPETDIAETENESENGTANVTVGCESSLAGGATVISVVCVAAYALMRKKKED